MAILDDDRMRRLRQANRTLRDLENQLLRPRGIPESDVTWTAKPVDSVCAALDQALPQFPDPPPAAKYQERIAAHAHQP